MAFLVNSVQNSVRNLASAQAEVLVETPPTSTRRSPLVCRWLPDARPGGRLVARWEVAEEPADYEAADDEVADPCQQVAVILRSCYRAVA